jgi:hypothetical protein
MFSAAPVNGKHLNCSNIKVNIWIIFNVETKRLKGLEIVWY